MGYYSHTAKGTTLELSVRPRAGRNRVVGLQSERLRVEIKAPDEGGKANEALIRFMAKLLGVPSESILVLTGKTARKKTLLVRRRLDEKLLETLALYGAVGKKTNSKRTLRNDTTGK